MASGSKTNSNYTRSGNGDGMSEGIVRSAMPRGQTDQASYPQDNVTGVPLKNTKGGSFGGSDTNLSHSLNGASAVQK